MKVIQKNSGEPIALDICLNLFNLDSKGDFIVLDSDESYHNYLIYVQAENNFGITGGFEKYLIDLNYKVIPSFKSDIETFFVSISKQMNS